MRGQAVLAIVWLVSRMPLESGMTETPDLMPLDYQLHILVMRITPQLWSRKPAVAIAVHLRILSIDEAVRYPRRWV